MKLATLTLLVLVASSPVLQASPQSSGPGKASGATQSARKPSRGRKTSAVPDANSSVEVIGANSESRATIDHPLLPIASIGNSLGSRSGTPIQIRLKQTVDSGHAHNGDTLDATLASPLANLPVGTPVELTVVQASPAGALLSSGELSIQVIRIGTQAILSDTISAQGREGKKEQADSAPAIGTEAVFQAGQVISLPAA